jgi:hypothetical protein
MGGLVPGRRAARGGGSSGDAVALLCGVALGTLAWYCGFAAIVAVAAQRVGRRLIAAVDVIIGTGLVVFGAVLGYRALGDETA